MLAAPPVAVPPAISARGASLGPLAVGGGFLVFGRTIGAEEEGTTAVEERRLAGGPTRRIAPDAVRAFGVASTSRWVLFADTARGRTELVSMRHGGSRRLVLSRSVITPLAQRGEEVAWAESRGRQVRVVVRDMRSGRNWVAGVMARCARRRCYRVDEVTLARQGVVWDRGAIGSFPSFVLRRRRGGQVQRVSVPGDPQPDLVPSTNGAFFRSYGRGWMRWDFGEARPRRVASVAPLGNVLAVDGRRLFLLSGTRCSPSLVVRGAGRATQTFAAPPVRGASLCRSFSGFAREGRRLFLAWAIEPAISIAAHSDVGLVGKIVVRSLR